MNRAFIFIASYPPTSPTPSHPFHLPGDVVVCVTKPGEGGRSDQFVEGRAKHAVAQGRKEGLVGGDDAASLGVALGEAALIPTQSDDSDG